MVIKIFLNKWYFKSNLGGKFEHQSNLNIVAKSEIKERKEYWEGLSVSIEPNDEQNDEQLR
jgi:hypothetical protein